MRCLAIGILLLPMTSFSLDPPVRLWEKQYYHEHDGCFFRDMELSPEGNLFITGSAYDWTEPIEPYYCAFLLDLDGNLLWSVEQPWYVGKGNDGIILSDSSYVITGRCVETPDSTYSLFIMKIDQSGSIEWTKIYDYPETKEEGYGITCLPDGGFAVCGRVHGTSSQLGQAWLLRTDAQGDTLWTDMWGTANTNRGADIVFNNNEICMITLGMDDTLTTYGTHLLFFDSDGTYIRGTAEPMTTEPSAICTASDGGYTFTNTLNPRLWHTDQYGNILWWYEIYNYGNEEGYDVIRTMDNGYIFCGWGGEWPEPLPNTDCTIAPCAEVDTGWTQDAWLVKFDQEGNQQWEIKREAQTTCCHYYSVVQLPEGGYIACGLWGSSGYLARYAPETGISSPDSETSLSLLVSPNPCSFVLSASFYLLEPGTASIRIYDLSGRLVSSIADGEFTAGWNTVEWAVPEELSSGCYFVEYSSEHGSRTEAVALIR